MPEPPCSSGTVRPIRSSLGELVPELGLEADRVVLEGAHRLDDGGRRR